ncbi:MAG: EamA family transporter [Bacteriovoracaceae bacterium]|nr:DMT family transporter [Bacteroidota bacterium]
MKQLKGYIAISLAAVMWGVAASVAKSFFNKAYEPLILVQMRVTLSFALMFLFFLFTNRSLLRFNLKDIPHILIVGILGVAGSNYFYYAAIKETNVSTAILVQYSAPVMVMIYTVLFQKEHLSVAKVTSLVLSIGGIVLAIGAYNAEILKGTIHGIIFALLAAVSFSIFTISGKSLTQKYSIWTGLIYLLGAATLFWSCINTPMDILQAHYTVEDWRVFGVIALISILIPYTLYYYGLHHIQSSKAIIVSTLEPVVAIVSEWMFLDGTMGPVQIVGAICVITAILILQRDSDKGEPIIVSE